MNKIHHSIRSISISLLLLALFISQTTLGSAKGRAKNQKHERAAARESRIRRAEAQRLAARRRAEEARQAAIARERAAEEALRDRVQSLIAKDDVAGEDPEVRRVALNALGHHAGTVVVMDPKSGRVYSVVNQQWALREGVKPCSTIKLVTGLAGLNEKVINPTDTAAISYSNKVDLTHALAFSKNEYFQQVGGQVGFSKMISYAHELGLGEKTGINTRDESQGQVPRLKSGFAVNHMSSHGDDFKVTALQLATLISAMANGGKLITPFVPRTAKDEQRSAPKIRRVVNINAEAFRQMVPGMIGAVNYGSGRKASNSQEVIAGKTGTCIEQGAWIGLFTSYAPLSNPRLAVVVIGRGVDGRSHFPAVVAGRIYRDLGARFGTPTTLQIAGTNNSSTKAEAASNALLADDEESEAADEEAATKLTSDQRAAMSTTIWGDARRAADSKVKRVVMPIPTRPEPAAKTAKTPPPAESKPAVRPRRVAPLQP